MMSVARSMNAGKGLSLVDGELGETKRKPFDRQIPIGILKFHQ
jgi:hypothetical protein